MKKGLLIFTAVVLMLSIPALVLAANSKDTPANDQGKNIYLYPKDPVTWEIIWGGAWGKVSYGKENVSFSGHNLPVGECYCLIVYGPDWPNAVCIGSGKVNKGGNIQIGGKVALQDGDKVWLVPCSDVNCEAGIMTAWNPAKYLFEHDLVGPKD